MEGRDTCGRSPDTFADRIAPPGLVLSHPRGLFTTPALSLFTFATGEKMVPCLLGKVRAAGRSFGSDSSNFSPLSFGSFANPALISDVFRRLLLFLMAERNVQRVVFFRQPAKGRRLFLLQITLRAVSVGSVIPCRGTSWVPTMGKVGDPLLWRWLAQPSSPNTNNSPPPFAPKSEKTNRGALQAFPLGSPTYLRSLAVTPMDSLWMET